MAGTTGRAGHGRDGGDDRAVRHGAGSVGAAGATALQTALSALDGLTASGVLPVVARAVDRLARTDLDGLSDTETDDLLAGLHRPLQQLEGLRARVASVQQRRRLAVRGSGSIDATLADHRQDLGRRQRLAPGEVRRVLDAGRAAADGTVTGRAVTDGRLGVSQASTIAQVLVSLVGPQRDAVEAELVALAAQLDPVAFGKVARRVQGRVQPEVLAKKQRRQETERRFRATDTEDGGFAFSGLLHGSAAETARVALQAFRRPDTPDERRTPDQRGADAFEQLCATALAAGVAPARHGVRPQVLVTIDAAQLAVLHTAPDTVVGAFVGSGQPIAGTQFRHLVADSRLVRVVRDAGAVPIEVSTTVRTVPAGLWRALLVRDGGCRWPGCDAPPDWCDVAHATHAYTRGGRLSLANAVLLCRRHHRRFDSTSQAVHIDGTHVHFPRVAHVSRHHPPRRPAHAANGPAGPDRPPPRPPTGPIGSYGPTEDEPVDDPRSGGARASPAADAGQPTLLGVP